MKAKNVFRSLAMGVAVALLAACAGAPPSNAINESLSSDIAQNQVLAAQKKPVPKQVISALTPSLMANPDAATKAADQRFDIAVNNVPAATFFSQLASGTPYNIIVSPKVTGAISLNLKQVTIQEVLDTVHNIYGYQYEVKPYGYEIYPFDLQTRIFKINYINLVRKGASSAQVSSTDFAQSSSSSSSSTSSSSGTTTTAIPASNVQTTSTHDLWKQLDSTLKIMIGSEDGRMVAVNPEAGLVYVKADPNQMRIVTQYLDSMQASVVRQVIIEAKILEVTLNKGYDAGIDWSVLGNNISQNALYSKGSNEAQEFPGMPSFNSVFQLNITGGADFSMVVNALATQGNVQVLSSPRVSVLNNQQAVIKIGTDQFYVTGVESNTTTSTSTNTSNNVILTPFFSGIALGVTPQISDEGVVTLQLHPIISTVTTEVRKFTVNGQDSTLPLAKSEIRETDTIVSAKDGQVIIIGGLMQDTASERIAETPGLGSIPYVGALFRRTQQTGTKSELVILLRPIVVNNESNIKELQKTQNTIQEYNRGYHVGGYPSVFGTQGETQQN